MKPPDVLETYKSHDIMYNTYITNSMVLMAFVKYVSKCKIMVLERFHIVTKFQLEKRLKGATAFLLKRIILMIME